MSYHKRRTEESPKPVSKYLKERDFAVNRPWTYCPKEGLYTYVNGKKLSKKEFEKKYPVFRPAHFYVCLDNPDKTRVYLQ